MIPDPLLPGDGLDLGHTYAADKLAGRSGDRLEHGACNRAAGDDSRPVSTWSSVDW